MYRQQRHIYKRLNNLTDAVITAASFILAYHVRNNLAATAAYAYLGRLASFEYYATIFALSCIIWPLLTNWHGLYSTHTRDLKNDVIVIFRSSAEAMLLLIAISYLFQLAVISRALIVGFAVTNFVLLSLKASLIRLYSAYQRSRGKGLKNVILVGEAGSTSKVIGLLKGRPELGLNVVGVIGLDQLAGIRDLLHGHAIDQVVFLVGRKTLPDIEEAMFICEEEGVEAWLATDLFELTLSRLEIEELGDLRFIVFRTAPPLSWQMVIKYFLDIAFAALFLTLLSPIFLVTVILIRLGSKGPAFIRQERVGLRGKRFTLYKFRSMIDGGKVTSIGRFLRKSGMDELPQLINILKGEMSFVGPRPHIPEEVALYVHGWQRRRLSMKPGITCHRQILHPQKVTFDKGMELDLNYIDNWSLGKDIAIVIKTIPLILSRFGRERIDN